MADIWQTVEQAAVALGMSVRTVNRHISAGKIASRLNDGRREVLVSVPDPEPDVLKASVREAFARLNAAAEPEAGEVSDTLDWSYEPSDNTVASTPTLSDTPPVNEQPVIKEEAEPYTQPTTVHIPSADQSNDDMTSRIGFDAQTVLALADNASDKAEMAVSAYQALARMADARAEVTRRNARFAWSMVAVMAAGVTVAVGWTTHHLTAARAESQYLQQQLSATSAMATDIRQQRDMLQTELSASRESMSRAEGKLEAATQASARLQAELKQATETRHAEAVKAPATQPGNLFSRVARLLD